LNVPKRISIFNPKTHKNHILTKRCKKLPCKNNDVIKVNNIPFQIFSKEKEKKLVSGEIKNIKELIKTKKMIPQGTPLLTFILSYKGSIILS
jgi:hypothetical protein